MMGPILHLANYRQHILYTVFYQKNLPYTTSRTISKQGTAQTDAKPYHTASLIISRCCITKKEVALLQPQGTHRNAFFILSHYIADYHMPLHCDARPFSDESGIHGAIEKKWEDLVKKSYNIDKDNNRFFYAPEGYPRQLNPTQFILDVENDIATRKYTHGWGSNNNNTWDYMSAVSQYSYLFSYYLIPETFKNSQSMQELMEQTEWGQNFDKYSTMIFGDAIDSLARIWLHVWIKFRNWLYNLKSPSAKTDGLSKKRFL